LLSNPLEQMLIFVRQAAPILWGRIHLRPQLRGGMPGPSRIVEDGASKGDHVGLSTGDDLFSLFGFGNETDGDGR